MSLASLSLVLVAAVLHAGWNVLAKRGNDSFLFLWTAVAIGATIFSPWILLAALEGDLTAASAPYLIATCAVHAVYFFALGQSYRYGDLSQVYPIARGLGVALVPLLAYLFLDEQLTRLGYAGIGLVIVGIIAIKRIGGRGEPVVARRGTLWALLTGLCVGTYSTIDKAGVGNLDPVAYVSILGLGCCALLIPVVVKRRAALATEWRTNRKWIAVAALFSLTAYLFVLFAFRLSKASYVVAGRESSIIISALVGSLWLREGPLRPRLLGASIILAGVVLIALAE